MIRMVIILIPFFRFSYSDARISLIGYGEHMMWPQHYTTGGNVNINDKVNNMDFAERVPLLTLEVHNLIVFV